MKPFIKWVGGKQKILNKFIDKIDTNKIYVETFLGGGSVLFTLQPTKAFVFDINEYLINCYIQIKKHPNKVIKYLTRYKNTEDKYYKYRIKYNNLKTNVKSKKDKIKLCSLFIYLNKTGFRGLYRENKKGEYNVPYGNYKNINYDFDTMIEISNYLNNNDIKIKCLSYEQSIKYCLKKHNSSELFFYFDPPYDKVKSTYFNYGGFDLYDHKNIYKSIKKYKLNFLMSNSNTENIKNIYKKYNIEEINVNRSIGNSKCKEILIYN